MMTLAAAVLAVSASAQVYVGGNVGIASAKTEGSDAETTYRFLPEIGYNINNDRAVGVTFGWAYGAMTNGSQTTISYNGDRTVEVAPYVRYTFVHSKLLNVFMDGTLGYGHIYGNGANTDVYSIGLKPGVALNVSKHVSVVAHIGFFGYQQISPKNADKTNIWTANLDGNNILLGVYYNF